MSRTFGYRELLTKEIVEAWRTYRLGVLCGLFIVLGIAVPVLVRFLPRLLRLLGARRGELDLEQAGVAGVISLLTDNLILLGAVAAVLVTMGAIAGERRRGTLALLLARPISRAAVLWAKFVALGMSFGLAIGLAILAAWLYASILYEPQPALPWLQLGAVVWLSAMAYVAVTLFGSVVAPTTLGAGAIGAAFLGAMSVASSVAPAARLLPAGLAEVAHAVGLEDVSPDLVPAITIAASIGVIGVALLLAWWRFRRLEA